MKVHRNARTCPKSRKLLVDRVLEEGWSVTAAAAAAGVSERTVWRWVKRWREQGEQGLLDRSSRPRRSPSRLPAAKVEAIEKLRRLRMTGAQIVEVLGIPLSTVSLWLKRIGLGRRSRLEPPEPPNRYERRHPGELVHVDIKQLGRISKRGAGHRVVGSRKSQITPRKHDGRRIARSTGFEYVHVMVDDHTRLAYAEVLPTLTAGDAVGFLRRAVAWFAERGGRHPLGDVGQRLGLCRTCSPKGARRAGLEAPAHPALPPANQRQGLCLRMAGPSAWTERLPAPGGLTQAKGMPRC